MKGGKNRLMKYGIQVGPGKVIGQVPPHPYIRPAEESSVSTALDRIKQTAADELALLKYKTSRKASR